MTYAFTLLIYFEIYALVAASLNLLIGYSGLLQVAHAAYFGIGAYTLALLTTRAGMPFPAALVLAGVLGAASSLLVSLPSRRMRGDSFVFMSMAVQIALYSLMVNWSELTGGSLGVAAIPRPRIAGSIFATEGRILALYTILAALLLGILGWLSASPFFRSLQAMRDDELAARSLGIAVDKLRIWVFLIASAVVGVAGGMYAGFVSYIDPKGFSLDESILMLSAVIVGGTGNVRGPIVGAVTLIAIPEALRLARLPDAVGSNIRLLAYGLLLLLMMRLRPQGIAGRYRFE